MALGRVKIWGEGAGELAKLVHLDGVEPFGKWGLVDNGDYWVVTVDCSYDDGDNCPACGQVDTLWVMSPDGEFEPAPGFRVHTFYMGKVYVA